MLSSVLRRSEPVQVNTLPSCGPFVPIRELLPSNEALRRKNRGDGEAYDTRFQIVLLLIKDMLDSPQEAQTQHWRSRPSLVWPYR